MGERQDRRRYERGDAEVVERRAAVKNVVRPTSCCQMPCGGEKETSERCQQESHVCDPINERVGLGITERRRRKYESNVVDDVYGRDQVRIDWWHVSIGCDKRTNGLLLKVSL